jgi:P27 family predicted phage terminase small subunit
MGRRGPPPEPSARKRERRVRPSRINHAEPRPSPTDLDPPFELSEDASEVWRRLAPDLAGAGVLTTWDLDVFAEYCELVVTVREARLAVRVGLLVNGRRDPVVTSPAWRVYRDALSLLRSLAQELGLTPSARSSIRVPSPRERREAEQGGPA